MGHVTTTRTSCRHGNSDSQLAHGRPSWSGDLECLEEFDCIGEERRRLRPPDQLSVTVTVTVTDPSKVLVLVTVAKQPEDMSC